MGPQAPPILAFLARKSTRPVNSETRKRRIRVSRAEVLAWVRDLSDEDAFMAFVTANAQSELYPLEVGMHALKSGLDQKAYAAKKGYCSPNSSASPLRGKGLRFRAHVGHAQDQWRHLAEIHAAPSWLWPALVSAMLGGGLTVEQTRNAVKAVAGAEEPPARFDSASASNESPNYLPA